MSSARRQPRANETLLRYVGREKEAPGREAAKALFALKELIMLDLDPTVMARLVRVAEWYDLTPARYADIILTRAIDELVSVIPNLDYLTELR